jgi:hypothetical protein
LTATPDPFLDDAFLGGSGVEESEEGQVAVPGAPADSYRPPATDHFDVTLFALLALVLGLIVWSNIWLRRRAERQRDEGPTPGPTP